MSDRALKTALIISLLANAFLAAATAAGGVYLYNAINERALLQRRTPMAMVARDLDPAVREQLKQNMRSIALDAAPDFREARAARKHAAELAAASSFDAAAVQADLAKARAAEERGRERLDNGFVDFMKSQPQPVRAVLAKALPGRANQHPGGHGPGGGPGGPGGPDHDGPPPPDAGAPSPQH